MPFETDAIPWFMLRLTLPCLLLALLLTGCADDFGAPGPVHSVFSRALADRYDRLAAACGAAGFSTKAAQARDGVMPPLADPTAKTAGDQATLTAEHDQLLQALQAGAWIDTPLDAADAQAAYDCRAAELAGACEKPVQFPDDPSTPTLDLTIMPPAAPVSCADRLATAMAALRPPPPRPLDVMIDFMPHSIGIEPAGMTELAAIARPLRGQPGWTVVLSGYAEADEVLPDDRNIGLRRALSVRNALQQYGIDRAAMLTAGGDPGAYGNLPRVEVKVMTDGDARQLQLAVPALRENFGAATPVF